MAQGPNLKRLRVLMTRREIVPERLPGSTTVVLDVFMATTTLLTILENGARGVYPAGSLEEAEEVRARLEAAGADVLRGGEQDAALIDGYDHGPFPEEYAPEVVANKDVIFVTTNGTRAIADATSSERILLGSLRNAPAVARHLQESETDSIHLVCAGSAGRFTVEDFLGAATIISNMDLTGWRLNDAAWLAKDFAARYKGEEKQALAQSRAGRWFFDNDRPAAFDFVADIGASGLIPEISEGKAISHQDLKPYT